MLYKDGYQLEHVKYIKHRHIAKWLNEKISTGTIKNRMSHLCWLTEKLNTAYIIPNNDELNIPQHIYVSQKDKKAQRRALRKNFKPLYAVKFTGPEIIWLVTRRKLKIKPPYRRPKRPIKSGPTKQQMTKKR